MKKKPSHFALLSASLLPDSLQVMRVGAFYNCKFLQEIIIPAQISAGT